MKILHLDPDQYYHRKLADEVASFAEVIGLTAAGRTFETLNEAEPDAVVMELLLEDTHGHELLTRITSHSRHSRIPIVIFTELKHMEDVEKALELGVTGFFVKGQNSLSEVRELLLKLE